MWAALATYLSAPPKGGTAYIAPQPQPVPNAVPIAIALGVLGIGAVILLGKK